MKNIILLSLILLLLISASCNTTEPPSNTTLTLKLEDVSCIEAWIKLKTTNLQLPTTLTLIQFNPTGDTVTQNIILSNADSLLYIDSLLPNQTYKFIATIEQSNNKSNELSVTTLDTTSHNFTFQSWTFGTIGSSTLYDVAIINENNIWAVGEIYVADTSINGYTKYNAVHWDGNNWGLKKIGGYGYWPCRTVFAFSATDIWFEGTIHWDGSNYTVHMNGWPLMPNGDNWQVNKMWGSSPNDLYAVGNNGNIAHYNGQSWSKIESGTDLNINDIWGDYNEKTKQWEILAVASNIYSGYDKNVINIKNNSSEILNKDGIEEVLSGVWFQSNKKYYLVGSGTYEKKYLTDIIWKGDPLDITNYFENSIRANDINDIIIVGAFGEVLHFNGICWKSFINETFLSNGTYLSGDIKNNLIIALGYQYAQAIITIGQR
jgi:hypothetical protein